LFTGGGFNLSLELFSLILWTELNYIKLWEYHMTNPWRFM
jgi:hypothetical protein